MKNDNGIVFVNFYKEYILNLKPNITIYILKVISYFKYE